MVPGNTYDTFYYTRCPIGRIRYSNTDRSGFISEVSYENTSLLQGMLSIGICISKCFHKKTHRKAILFRCEGKIKCSFWHIIIQRISDYLTSFCHSNVVNSLSLVLNIILQVGNKKRYTFVTGKVI